MNYQLAKILEFDLAGVVAAVVVAVEEHRNLRTYFQSAPVAAAAAVASYRNPRMDLHFVDFVVAA